MNNDVNFTISDISYLLEQVNAKDVVNLISPFVLGYVSYRSGKSLVRKYKINKDLKVKDISCVYMPPEIERINKNYNRELILSKEYIFSILLFVDTIINEIDDKNLDIFYNNFDSLKVEKIDEFSKKTILGKYDNIKNTIYIKEDYCIYHELFHMISSVNTELVKYCGFLQQYEKFYIGHGVNEGYTQLLTERYFSSVPNVVGSGYQLEKKFMGMLEQIVGKERMEELYLNANLYGLVVELQKYNSTYNIMKFITYMDFIKKYLNSSWVSSIILKYSLKCLREIYLFLIETYFSKIKNEIDREYFLNEELEDIIGFGMEIYVELNGNEYNIFGFEDYVDFFDRLGYIKTVDGEKRYYVNQIEDNKPKVKTRLYLCR